MGTDWEVESVLRRGEERQRRYVQREGNYERLTSLERRILWFFSKKNRLDVLECIYFVHLIIISYLKKND